MDLSELRVFLKVASERSFSLQTPNGELGQRPASDKGRSLT